MAFDNFLADRIRNVLKEKNKRFKEVKMMGNLCFMVNNKMLLRVTDNKLIVRVNSADFNEALSRYGSNIILYKNKPLKNYLLIEPEGIDKEMDLDYWIEQCLAYKTNQ